MIQFSDPIFEIPKYLDLVPWFLIKPQLGILSGGSGGSR